MTVEALTATTVLWCLLILNPALWQQLTDWHPIKTWVDVPFLGSFFVLTFVVTYLFFTPLTLSRTLIKPVLGMVVVMSSLATYFVAHYGILIDKTMIRNVFATNAAETSELLSLGLLTQVLLSGVLPAAIIQFVPLTLQTRREVLLRRLISLTGLLLLVAVIAATFYQSHAALLRNHREVRHMLTPVNIIASTAGLAAEAVQRPLPYESIAAGVQLGPHWQNTTSTVSGKAGESKRKRPVVIVLVVGETARAHNFGLNDYARQTTPRLAEASDLIAFQEVTACGTSTAISVPCMFSDLTREEFSPRKARARDNLLDVLERAGFAVTWFDNNTSCNGVCGNRPELRADPQEQAALCPEGAPCFDGAIFERMWTQLSTINQDMVVVMHMLGSHGPGYHLRYPAEFERFTPVCRETDFALCSRDEIVNAYDNSILYTDYLVAETISRLAARTDQLDVGMLYVSDHGESLGENGLFLHAIPYSVAPLDQLRVPMVFWSSDGLVARMGLDLGCVRQQTHKPLSHDHFFHSVLGLLDITLPAKRDELDIFGSCMPS